MSEQKRRILLMYITKVSGHRQATLALKECIKTLSPEVDVPLVNGFGYTYPILEKVVHNTYMRVVKSTPKVWDYMYDNPKVVKNLGSGQKFLYEASHKKIKRLIDRYKPDTVVCTQAFPCGMVAHYKKTNNLNFNVVGVLTDYAPHSFWLCDGGVDYYIVPSTDTKDRFIKKGVPGDMIKVYGIPINTKFAEQKDKKPIAHELGLDASKPTILVMGGGSGLGPIKKIVRSLLKMEQDVQLVVISGMNKKLNKWLQKKAPKSKKKILIYEFSKNIDELMEVATLIITKPGGMTTAECLAKGLPMVIINPLPGQEMRNTDFLLKKGIAIRVDKSGDVGEEVELLLKSPEKLSTMSKAAYDSGKPYSALNISKLILNMPKGEPLETLQDIQNV